MADKHPQRIGPYQILGPLGRGGMGEVFKAVQPSLNRIVAIKVLPAELANDPERVERFHREAAAVAMLNHSNVVHIIDMDRDGDLLYFVMEYVAGVSLDDVLQQRRLTLHEALGVSKDICRGLQAAHRQNIVHRDLSPRNVLVSEDLSTVKVADFGLSRVEALTRRLGTLTTGASMGTLHYIAPEQALDMGKADHRADIYSMGAILFEMLTGRVPVGRFNLPSQLNSEVPAELDPLVLKCLAADPQDRYQTVDELLRDLFRLEDQLRLGLAQALRGMGQSTTRLLRTSSGRIGSNRWWLAGAVAAAVLVGVVAFVLLRPDAPAGAGAADLALAEPVEGAQPGLDERDLVDLPAGALPPPVVEEVRERRQRTTPPEASAPTEPPPAPIAAVEPPPAPVREEELGRALAVARDKLAAGLVAQAQTDLQELMSAYAGEPGLGAVRMLQAEILEDAGQREEALALYVEIARLYPVAAAEALYRAGDLLRQGRGRPAAEAAADAWTRLVAEHPDSPFAPRALAARAKVETEAKLVGDDATLGRRAPRALATYRELAERYPEAPEIEEALWRLAQLYRDEDRFDLAVQTFQKLGESFPATRHDTWWEAAELLARRLKDPAGAVAAYARVPERSPNYAAARKKLEKLEAGS